ncbi:MAG: polyprenyl synthetase family protein [Acidobacteria bacterium]|nr:polyprenyl synthetase family protein [Acidobacteriota bacterium]
MTKASSEADETRDAARAADEADEARIANGAGVEAAREFLSRARALVEARLDCVVPAETAEPVAVHAAMRWSLFAGGKRLRPALVVAAGETFGARAESLLATACAFELLHTYSLIHDDLPSMDDDELRRGRATCHVRFGEATAILAGDALQSLAFQLIAEDARVDAESRVKVVAELARAAGTPAGMVAGQSLDLAAESRADVSSDELDLIHQRKTGAVITAAVRCGALVARAPRHELEAVSIYAARLGLLFQITDDLLDVTASAEDLGKTPGKDARARKATYPALHGLDAARRRAREVYEEACAALAEIDRPTTLLRSLARLTLERRA